MAALERLPEPAATPAFGSRLVLSGEAQSLGFVPQPKLRLVCGWVGGVPRAKRNPSIQPLGFAPLSPSELPGSPENPAPTSFADAVSDRNPNGPNPAIPGPGSLAIPKRNKQ